MNYHTLQQLPPTNHQKKLGFLAINPYICMDCNYLMCKMRKGMGTIKKSVALVAHDNMKRDLVAYYVLQVNKQKLTSEDVDAKIKELDEKNERPLEELGYDQLEFEQEAALDKAMDILYAQAEIKN